jgi:integrative and conjugative element protein (TIGR02256 family)
MHETGPVKSRIYKFQDSDQELIFAEEVLSVFRDYCQKGAEPEAGGLLFAEFNLPKVNIVKASIPDAKDKRWRTLFIPNRFLQRRLIKQYFKKGQHLVGEWHTHPQNKPSPSETDVGSMSDSFLKSRHELNYFIMVIVGNSARNLELWVSAHNGSNICRLKEFNSLDGND